MENRKPIQFLLCDDDEGFLHRLREALEVLLRERQVDFRICTACTMEEIPQSILSGCDIAFLDIDFVGKDYSGLDIARRIRASGKGAVIIFVTNFVEYAPEGYEVQAFRYLLKKHIFEKLESCLHLALEQVQTAPAVLSVKIDGERVDIPLAEILYIESQLRTVEIHLQSGNFHRCYRSISELEAQLEEQGFLRIHRSYLVNMGKLKRFQSKGAVLTDGTELPVSTQHYNEQKKKYLLWKQF